MVAWGKSNITKGLSADIISHEEERLNKYLAAIEGHVSMVKGFFASIAAYYSISQSQASLNKCYAHAIQKDEAIICKGKGLGLQVHTYDNLILLNSLHNICSKTVMIVRLSNVHTYILYLVALSKTRV